MGKVRVTGYLQVPESDRSAVDEALPVHRDLSREEAGCLLFEVTRDDTDPGKWHLLEEYVSQAAFDYHRERSANSPWASVSANVQRVLEITESDD